MKEQQLKTIIEILKKSITIEQLKDEIRESQEECERGEFYTVQALEKDMESW